MIKKRLGLDASSLVVEIASNDGYLLQHFLPLGVPVLGHRACSRTLPRWRVQKAFRPASISSAAPCQRLASEGRMADLIIGNNVLAQVPDLNDFIAGIGAL